MDEEGQQRSDEVPVADNSQAVPEQPHSTADYSRYAPPAKPPAQWRRWVIWAGIVLFVFAILAIAYKTLSNKPKKPSTATTSQNQVAQTQATSAAIITTATKNYASQNFALSFNYPQDWTVTDSGGGVMTVKSPSLTLKDSSGQSQKAFVVLTFRNKTQKLAEFDAGSAVAERDSIKIAYTKPTQSQRGDTYISFLRYAKSSSGLDGVYITGNSGYKAGQTIPLADIQKVDPVINYSFIRDTSGTKIAAGPVTIASSVWDDSNFSTPLINVLKSLVIT